MFVCVGLFCRMVEILSTLLSENTIFSWAKIFVDVNFWWDKIFMDRFFLSFFVAIIIDTASGHFLAFALSVVLSAGQAGRQAWLSWLEVVDLIIIAAIYGRGNWHERGGRSFFFSSCCLISLNPFNDTVASCLFLV